VKGRAISRALLGIGYAAAGMLHLLLPAPFVAIVPPWVPAAGTVVMLTGWAELAGAAGVGQGPSRRFRMAAAWGLAAYAFCVWPANVQHMLIDLAQPSRGLGLAYHLPRLALQPLLIWWPLWASGVLSWPFAGPPGANAGRARSNRAP